MNIEIDVNMYFDGRVIVDVDVALENNGIYVTLYKYGCGFEYIWISGYLNVHAFI